MKFNLRKINPVRNSKAALNRAGIITSKKSHHKQRGIISNGVKEYILDLLFPLRCLNCQKEGFWLCSKCFKKINFQSKQVCPVCQKESKNGRVCRYCFDKSQLSALIVIGDYKNELLQKAIHCLKYRFASEIRVFFAQLLTEFFKSNKMFGQKQYLIIPIPLHKKRLKFRGFNQSELIGQELVNIIPGKLEINNLRRKRHTLPQVKLSAKERKNNLKKAFVLKSPLEILGKSVILIDDVYTTGSTMNEAAKVLKKAKAKEVIGLVIARG